MDFYSLNNKEASPEVIQEKYREEVESVTNKKDQDTSKTVKAKSKKVTKNNQERTYKTKMTMMIAISDSINV